MDNASELIVRAGECGFEGNNDLYGFGIRLGLYFQLFSTVLANSFLKSTGYPHFFRLSSAAVGLSTFIVMMMETVKRDVLAVEISVILWVMSMQLMGLAMPDNIGTIDFTRLIKSLVMYFPLGGYLIWYYFRGLDSLPRTQCPDEYAFFYAKVSLYHWFRKLGEAISIILMVVFVIMLIIFPPLIMGGCTKFSIADVISDEEEVGEAEQHQTDMAQQNVEASLSLVTFITIITLLVLGSVTILPAEFTIKWNKISGVYKLDSIGQLIPLVLGLGQLLDVFYHVFKKVIGHEEGNEESNEEEAPEPCPHRITHERIELGRRSK